jgi:hypothetical protein
MVKRPIGSDGEPSSPNCRVSAGVKARQPFFELRICPRYAAFIFVAGDLAAFKFLPLNFHHPALRRDESSFDLGLGICGVHG